LASRQVKTNCFLCPNQCSVILEVSEEGLVQDAWKIFRGHDPLDVKKQCKQLNGVLDKNLDNAKSMIQRPTKPRIITGGH